ncbi:unnamed protein product [Gadus morhua 'NCC']
MPRNHPLWTIRALTTVTGPFPSTHSPILPRMRLSLETLGKVQFSQQVSGLATISFSVSPADAAVRGAQGPVYLNREAL